MNRWLAGLALLPVLAQTGCAQPECSSIDFTLAECRVVAENDFARLRLPSGIEVRFQDPAVVDADSWDARGLLELIEPGTVRARVAGPGQFAISVDPGTSGASSLRVLVDNVDPAANVLVGAPGEEMVVPPPSPAGLLRAVTVDLTGLETTWIRGDRACPDRYRFAVTADIQTNPEQFERIVERLQFEAEEGQATGEPLVGLAIVGDLTESSRDDEYLRVDAMLRAAPVPVAVTAGNHDIYRPLRPHYNARFGPGNYTFEVCDTKMVMLDTGSGSIARSVEARLPELLAPEGAEHLLLGVHHPPYAGHTAAGWSMEDRAQHLLVEAAIAGVDLIVAGHSHQLRRFADIDVGGVKLEEIIVGTAGAFQGLGVPRYGYLRVTFGAEGIERCFVEVPPPGFDGPANDAPNGLSYCPD